MNDSLQLPAARSPSSKQGAAPLHVAASFLVEPPAASHIVQFYDDEAFLFRTVGSFASAGLDAGDAVLLIASEAHVKGILAQIDPERLAAGLSTGQILVFDARTTLESLLRDGMLDPDRFQAALNGMFSTAQRRPGQRMRAFGEMVDLLWRDGNTRAAIHLEELWAAAVQERSITLLCTYGSDNFREPGDSAGFADVCRTHTHVMPSESFSQLGDSESRLREISLLQQQARMLEGEIRQRKAIESVLREVLERRAQVEAALRACLEREQEARSQTQANDAFKEVFMDILGHDLRNPLNAILTTARLMTLRGELLPESQKRLDRVVSSGVRMQRMIEQILDMARDRLTTGIAVSRTAPRDLAPLIAKIVEEARLSHPEQRIELRSEGRCFASVDADRFEQVVANLLLNATTHGDRRRPIVVHVAARKDPTLPGSSWISLGVRNFGPPIDAACLPLLFDPFRRERKPKGHSAGLGLGLYISERIVRAHGGSLRVTSSEFEGTLFEVLIPRDTDSLEAALPNP